jgi:hypothetical protein
MMKNFSITEESAGDASQHSLIKPLRRSAKELIISNVTEYYRQYILMMILVTLYVIFVVMNLDSDSNQYCKDVTRDFFENGCFQILTEPITIDNKTFSNPYGYEISTSGACGTYWCQARSCDQLINLNGTNTDIVQGDDDYYKYDTIEIVNAKNVMVAFYCGYVLATSVLNHATNTVIAVKSKIRPFYMTLAVLVLGIISGTAGVFGKIYLRGESVTNCYLVIAAFSILSLEINYRSFENIQCMRDFFSEIYLDRILVSDCHDYDLEYNNIMKTRTEKFQSIKVNKKLKDVSTVLEFKLLVEFACFLAFLVLVFLNLVYYERGEYYRYSVVYVSLSILLLLILSVMQVSVFNDNIFKTEGDLFVKTKLAVSILGFSPTTSLVISISFTTFLNLFNFLYANYNLCTFV